MAPYSMAGLLLCASERVSAMWSASYHVTEETSRFIISTIDRRLRRDAESALNITTRALANRSCGAGPIAIVVIDHARASTARTNQRFEFLNHQALPRHA